MGFIVLMLMIPLAMVHGLVGERAQLQWQAHQAIEQRWSSSQILTGPMLRIPTQSWRETEKGRRLLESAQLLLPDRLDMRAELAIEQRYYGIYQTPVYTTQIRFRGAFEPSQWSADGEKTKYLWNRAQLVLPVSDVRGLRSVETLRLADQDYQPISIELNNPQQDGIGFAVALPERPKQINGPLSFEIAFQLAGSRSLRMVPIGNSNRFEIGGAWPDPSFVGAYLPLERTIDSEKFSAVWGVLGLNRSFGQSIDDDADGQQKLIDASFGVELFQPIGIYKKTERATKYGMLFVALSFMGMFVFEILAKTRLHPIQYLLLGFALCTFYVVLLALSEHIGFAGAYSLAALALVLMVGGYSAAIMPCKQHGYWCGGLLSGIYLLLYWLLISQAYSLLVGALALLGMIAAIMYLTRQIDWFDLSGNSWSFKQT